MSRWIFIWPVATPSASQFWSLCVIFTQQLNHLTVTQQAPPAARETRTLHLPYGSCQDLYRHTIPSIRWPTRRRDLRCRRRVEMRTQVRATHHPEMEAMKRQRSPTEADRRNPTAIAVLSLGSHPMRRGQDSVRLTLPLMARHQHSQLCKVSILSAAMQVILVSLKE